MLDDHPSFDGIEAFICFEDYDRVPGFIISQTAYAFRKCIATHFKQQNIDLTPLEFALINRLATHQPLNQKTLAELTYKDRPAITRMLHRLITKGLVAKQLSHRDRRAYLVTLTKAGRQLRNRAAPVVQAVLLGALSQVSAEQLEITLDTLKQINRNLA